MGAVFYLGAGWPQWKPLGIPGTLLPLKRGSWLNLVKLTTTSLAVKLFISLAVKRFTNLVVKRFTSLVVKQLANLAVKQFISLVVKWFISLVLKRPTSSAGIQRSHKCRLTWYVVTLYTALIGQFVIEHAVERFI